ncbi:alpha-1,4-glucan--maltose-1-phosphate maltosyltransferase [Streptomyces marincola]|uniref:Alpha-1,4-glucan:maltose-1-phosphate maltosyltransferase n=1 Tax=Streptomyces marincola TaxID=2878388 RepID=A0A1W7D117_9ACTN|nr:alpha-1,4-glucan--maltose-1-phosphate maltosyltransferase [Streptomyces marincola]ARQ70599.1 alpha-1,4-glucan--maltose-1-phosphate maltosyltransferase [Streptomyces marincola]
MGKRLTIEALSPVNGGGEYPAKGVVGEHLPLSAVIWREGHDALAAHVTFTGPLGPDTERREVTVPLALTDPGEDRWEATVVPDRPGLWTFRVTAWSAPWETWRHGLRAKLDDGRPADRLTNELESGARLLERMAEGVRTPERAGILLRAARALRETALPLADRVAPALSPEVTELSRLHPVRDLETRGDAYPIWVDRPRALTGAWYEFFPRSTGGRDAAGRPVHGTFATAAADLPRIAGMGFDVVYLPPIHPIGEIHRKGANNALTAGPDDVGSPWAVGSADGGHDAVHPALGTLEDFDAFVDTARGLGLEVALDLALQCAPDHPWVHEHPEWFTHRPDGSIAYAENPPKRYQDIYPLDFDTDPAGLGAEVLRIVRFWADHGVRVFRVDNPHTKPAAFWHWLLWRVKSTHPDVLFLAEAFTRPAVLKGLARLGFTQSYTYFTWRTGRDELAAYARELADSADFLRPNLFVNTPDILHAGLHHAGPAMFAIRAALAATMSPTWGVYSGFELFENEPLRPGSEEYLDSEKYELRPRDHAAALASGRSLAPWITRLNEIRRARPALRQQRHLVVHPCDHDEVLAYTKTDPATGERTLCVITLDPAAPVDVTVALSPESTGRTTGAPFTAHDDITGEDVTLSAATRLRIDPRTAVARVISWGAR